LRGEESDRDEAFVRLLADRYKIDIHCKKFQTKDFADEHSISTQMAARDLRYEWFHELAENLSFDHIAIAHNSDDNIETFHLNLSRGTGISGIRGMEPKSGRIIRPILWASRQTISEYCSSNNLEYREDSSNQKTDYKRNYLRWEILPKFKKLNPSYSDTILKNIDFFRQSSNMLDEYFELLKEKIIHQDQDNIRINIAELLKIKEPSWFLFEFLSGYGYNSSQVGDIVLSVQAESGKRFESDNYILIKDREDFILSGKHIVDNGEYFLENKSGEIETPIKLKWHTFENNEFQIIKDSSIAHLDASKLLMPLKLRKWLPADSFKPLGMDTRKKLSDFFTDQKLSILEKEKVWLLLSDDEIVWVVGLRIDDRYKILPETKEILTISLIP